MKTPVRPRAPAVGPEHPVRRAGAAQQPRAQPRRRPPGPRRAGPGRLRLSARASSTACPTAATIDVDTNDAKDLAGRVFLQPWQTKGSSPLRGLGFGIAGTHGHGQRPSARATRRVSQVSVFSYATTVTANGDRQRWSPQAASSSARSACSPNTSQAHHEVAEGGDRPSPPSPPSSDELRLERDRLRAGHRRGGDLRQRQAQELLRPLRAQVGRASSWSRACNGSSVDDATFTGGYADADAIRPPGRRLGRGPQLDLEQQPQVRARLRADALQGRGGRRRRPSRPRRASRPACSCPSDQREKSYR